MVNGAAAIGRIEMGHPRWVENFLKGRRDLLVLGQLQFGRLMIPVLPNPCMIYSVKMQPKKLSNSAQ